MDSPPDISDADALTQRRQRLRALADRLLEAIEDIPLPDTFLEAERAQKAVRACDTLMVQLYTEPKSKSPSALRTPSPRATPVDDEDDDYDYGPFANLSDALKAEILQYGYDRPRDPTPQTDDTPIDHNPIPSSPPHRSTDPPP